MAPARERPVLRVVPPTPPEPARRLPPWRDWLLAGLLVLGGLILGWLVLRQSMADAAAVPRPGDALAWQADHPAALARAAELALDGDRSPEAARRALSLARRALVIDPMQGSAYRILAIAQARLGDPGAESRMMTIAGDRLKRDIPAQTWLIDQSLQRGRYAEAAERADGIMRAWPVSMHGPMTRRLSALALAPNGAADLARLLDSNPPWRSRFLITMARFGDNPGAATAVYTALRSGKHPPNQVETGALIQRLVTDGDYSRAFLIWAQLLPDEGLSQLADPYDGGFDGLPGATPFNWQFFNKRDGTVTEIAPAPDGDGRALYVRFTGAQPPPVLARQLLVLPPGPHRVKGRVRIERLSGAPRLSWTLRCAEPGRLIDGEPPNLQTGSGWQRFDFAIVVPAGCTAQWLSLSAVGRGKLDGEAWIDDLRITR